METGKLSSENLKEWIIDTITPVNEDVLIRPSVGEDCAAIAFGEYACVLSTDPITGAANEIGRLAVHINCNDIASAGVKPMALMLTILVPPETSQEELATIMKQASEEARKLGVDIIGGHTEITTAVNRPLVSATALGKQMTDKLITTGGGQVGDILVMTKNVALEGTGILAHDKAELLSEVLTQRELETAQVMLDQISVIPEGIIAGEVGVSAMHDVTEGGILGAVWEVCEASGVGCALNYSKLPIRDVTKKICAYFELDPLKLISSGAMLIAVPEDKSVELLNRFKEEGIEAQAIGKLTKGMDITLQYEDCKTLVSPPETDELYKVIA